jgi:hypothetical protein
MKLPLQDGTYSILMMIIMLPHYFATSFSPSTPNKSNVSSLGQYEHMLQSKFMKRNDNGCRLSLSADAVPAPLPESNNSSVDGGSGTTNKRRASNDFSDTDQNKAYINGLLQNLSAALDRWIVNGSLNTVRFEKLNHLYSTECHFLFVPHAY